MTGPSRRPSVLEVVDRWARERPQETAVSAPDGVLTYAGLAAHAVRFASALAAVGVGRDEAVGLLLGRSRESLPALLAVWRIGAVAVPLDTGHPVERLRYILRDADATVLIAGRMPEGLDLTGVRTVHPEQADGAAFTLLPETDAAPDACAYLVYTSGTTGRPKGVEVTYRGLDTFVDAIAGIGLTAGGLGLNAVSPAFDGWLWCSLLYLVHGQGVALVDLSLEGLREAAAGGGEILPAGLRTASLTPSLLAAHGDALGDAEVVVVAGEPCPPTLADRFVAGRRFLNVYGPTETTIAATWADSARGDDVRGIGRPLPGYRAYVLDDSLRPVPSGAQGELYVGGPAVARGYRGQPGLTAARFVPDLFAGYGARMYRTGDMVRLGTNGELEYRGRRDDQVKIRGHRVELGEVERIASELPEVVAAVCYLVPSGDALGLAVVTADGADAGLVVARVEDRCAALLPDAAVPQTVHVVHTLPTLATGKADRAALARGLATAGVSAATGVGMAAAELLAADDGPVADVRRTTLRERELLALWTELLGRDVVDVRADFFDLGGHSLLAARAVAELRQRTGLRVTLSQLLANPTAEAFAAELDRMATRQSREA
ncbi:Non-ribosomal peptide synthetase 20 [Frankia canadensis]|uniref:Non-ribosomal peptide synthetase 20 n=1 Tax=Frankia canadensis TaxID=1836972 RepID=A0A2I2L262_9ACTN|nr:non-ribosomal peptide synthetase [Frankia canadensis]SNQ52013.1 Non-ribosomal peptide synthetase 20 [Frankia canadensis]SOU59303.1 Non-ribosomal peptide synthetase 20 [Frankia canadensis]